MAVKEVERTERFRQALDKVRDTALRQQIAKQLEKLIERPEIGKPLRYGMKGERSVRVGPYRIVYFHSSDKLLLLNFGHRKSIYDK